jgi:hypothetical protein
MAAYLHRRGWRQIHRVDGIGWSGEPVLELRLRRS